MKNLLKNLNIIWQSTHFLISWQNLLHFVLPPPFLAMIFRYLPPPQFPSILEKLNPPYEVVTENHTFYQNNEWNSHQINQYSMQGRMIDL